MQTSNTAARMGAFKTFMGIVKKESPAGLYKGWKDRTDYCLLLLGELNFLTLRGYHKLGRLESI